MKTRYSKIYYYAFLFFALLLATDGAAQKRSTSTGVVKSNTLIQGKSSDQKDVAGERIGLRLQEAEIGEAEIAWMRVIYRVLDMNNDRNAVLYYPVEPDPTQDNLFRTIVKLLASGKISGYEFLDGREVFGDDYRVDPTELFDRFQISWTKGKTTAQGSTITVDDNDIPSSEVLSYYIIEKWSLDRRKNRLISRVEAICPVIHRAEDYGYEAARYPLCWIKYEDLRPYLMNSSVMMSDINNLPTGTYDDYFMGRKYEGEIYKTRNLRNRTLAEIYPDPDDLKNARDSIERVLSNFEKGMWVPSLDELQARVGILDDSPGKALVNTLSEPAVRSENKTRRVTGKPTGGQAKAAPIRSVRNRRRN